MHSELPACLTWAAEARVEAAVAAGGVKGRAAAARVVVMVG
jgi:hypothetical protein